MNGLDLDDRGKLRVEGGCHVAQSRSEPTKLLMLLLAVIPMLMVLGNAVLIPAMPEMQSKMHISALQVSLLITLFSVPAGIVIPFAGFLSDQLQRKFVIVPALLLFGAGGVLAGLAAWLVQDPYWLILGGRVLQGIGASGTAPIAMAVVGDLFKGSARSQALGINEAGNAFGKVVSPIVGAAVAAIAWYLIFFIFPVLCVPVAAAVWWLVPAPKKKAKKQSLRSYVKSLSSVFREEGRWLAVTYLCGAAGLFTLFGLLFDLSELLESSYQVVGIRKGLILAIPLLTLCTVALGAGAMIKRRKRLMKWSIVGGFCIVTASLVVTPLTGRSPWWLVGLASVSAFGIACALPSLNTLITSAVGSERRGVVTSLYGSVRFLGVAAGPPVFTWLREWSTTWMSFSIAGLSLLCALLAIFMIRPPAKAASVLHFGPRVVGRHKARS